MRSTLGLLALLVIAGVVRSEDVRYVDRAAKKEDVARGVTIQKEGPEGITFKSGAATKTIPALDIIDVLYAPAGIKPTDFRRPFDHDLQAVAPATAPGKRAELFQDALAGYKELLPKVTEPPIVRHLEYKIAQTLARMSDTDSTKTADAISALTKFCSGQTAGWQIVPALRLLSRLQEEKGELDAALKAYEQMGAIPGAPAEVVRDSTVMSARLLLRNKKAADAEKKLQGFIAKLKPDDPEMNRMQVLLAQCRIVAGKVAEGEGQLRNLIASSTDVSLKAQAHNTLGDAYRETNRLEDAFWEYLRVDVMYSDDRYEHAKALYYLSKLFDEVKRDAARAQECKERLKDKKYQGIEFQQRSLKEK
jgi:hypothetical protein